jgi:hypothetical protein
LILNTNTELKRLSLKNGTIQYFNGNGLIGCTNLEFICIDENEISQIQNFINASNLTNVVLSSYCSFTPGGDYNTVTGNVRLDSNNNGCDETDFSFPFFRLAVDLNAVSTNSSVFSNNNGVYHLYTATEGEYTFNSGIRKSLLTSQFLPNQGLLLSKKLIIVYQYIRFLYRCKWYSSGFRN